MTDDALDRLAAAIKSARTKHGLTQEQLAETLGMSIDSVSSMERSVIAPSFKTLILLSETLEIDLGPVLSPTVSQDSKKRAELANKIVGLLEGSTKREERLFVELAKVVRSTT